MPYRPQHRPLSRRAKLAGIAVAALACAAVTATPALAAPSGGSPALRVVPPTARTSADPGSTVDQQIEISNSGTAASDGVTLTLLTTPGLDLGESFSNCLYAPVSGQGGFWNRKAVCRIDTPLEPGRTYRLSTPLSVAVGRTAMNENLRYQVVGAEHSGTGGTPGHGSPLSLAPSDPGHVGTSPDAEQQITAVNTADLRATGDRVHGKRGERVTFTAKVTDEGPAWVGFPGDDQTALMVDIPQGTEAVQVPDACRPFYLDGPTGPALGKPEYVCTIYPDLLLPGTTFAFPFQVRIAKDATDTHAATWVTSVYGDHKDYAFDPDHTNDAADIEVKVTGPDGATGGGAGGSTGATGSAGPTAGGATNAPAAQAATTQTGPELAATGADSTPLFAATAFTTLLAGGVLTLAARRRSRG